MKKRILCLLFACVLVLPNFLLIAQAVDDEEENSFPYAIAYSSAKDIGIEKNVDAVEVLEYETKKVIVDTGSRDKISAEGLVVRLMALYVAVRHIDADSITIPASTVVDKSNNPLGLEEGMVVAVVDLVAAALYNDDVNSLTALAISLKGNLSSYIAIMNQYAKSFGMTNTNFTNITGEYDKNQYTTVDDILKLAFFCYSKELIVDAASAESHYIRTNEILEHKNVLENPFEFVKQSSEYYNGNIYGLGTSKDSKGVTTSIVVYMTSKQKYIMILRSKGNTACKDVVDTLDYVGKNYALIDISSVIFELGEKTTVEINGEEVHFSVVKSSLSNTNIVANLYYSKSVATLNDAYSIQPPETLPESVKVGTVIKNFKVMYNDSQLATVSLSVKSTGEEEQEEETLGFTVYEKSDEVKSTDKSFIQSHSWIILVGVIVAIGLAVIVAVGRINKI